MGEDKRRKVIEYYHEITLETLKYWKYRMGPEDWRNFRINYEGRLPNSILLDNQGKTFNQFDAEREEKHIYFWHDEKKYPDVPLNPGGSVYFNHPNELIYPLCNDKQRAYLRKIIMKMAYPSKDFEKYGCSY